MDAIQVREGEMDQMETAARHDAMRATATIDGEDAPAAVLSRETLMWSELTYKSRTFVFNRELVIRVVQEEGGWSFNSGDPELFGFGNTRSEAESLFRFDFASCWKEYACEDDSKLAPDAREFKKELLKLVKAQR
jgi:hypothetical protein